MENLALAPPKFLLGSSPSLTGISSRRPLFFSNLPKKRREGIVRTRNLISSVSQGNVDGTTRRIPRDVRERLGMEVFASISSSSRTEVSSVGVNPQLSAPSPPSSIGSPLFWIGVGVGLSALFSWKYAMQQAFKTLMGQMSTENKQFGNAVFSPGAPAFSPGSPFPYPMSTVSAPSAAPAPSASQPVVTVDVPATKVEPTSTKEVKDETEIKEEPKKYAFVDVSPDEVSKKSAFESPKESIETTPSQEVKYAGEDSQNGTTAKQDNGSPREQSQSNRKSGSVLSVEALEKMMEDPTVQKMVYPYLPEEMRNPATFKWMLQNPQYRQQLEDMLNNMGGSNEWDNKMMDSLKNFDLSSPEVKQQFDQIGLTPEEVISKIMANPDVAMAFQNPRVQAAIMDCSQNPLSIAKYQNDKEVMDVFNKISQLFPGVTGSP
ncbi:PREDICTED: protein TIC 40, chloroplastic isoform X2 [Nelumbo nucifera]|uniref:Protein TIC 40, chloroplastic n=1 Tax=Nelumbo nucifera TaxID=4432 RepID=A0A1U7Z077_NELNU|nr:PREDICTED: protein TIC 40, chloroplastic isoform X2 [Nelumbo nucifera]